LGYDIEERMKITMRWAGEAARGRVAESVAAYQEAFGHYTGLTWSEVTTLAMEFAGPIAAYDGAILEEIEGLAEGAAVDLSDLLAINARTEIMFGLEVSGPPECTPFSPALPRPRTDTCCSARTGTGGCARSIPRPCSRSTREGIGRRSRCCPRPA
jgi:hypothetical protein